METTALLTWRAPKLEAHTYTVQKTFDVLPVGETSEANEGALNDQACGSTSRRAMSVFEPREAHLRKAGVAHARGTQLTFSVEMIYSFILHLPISAVVQASVFPSSVCLCVRVRRANWSSRMALFGVVHGCYSSSS